jgi:hypothetical protein
MKILIKTNLILIICTTIFCHTVFTFTDTSSSLNKQPVLTLKSKEKGYKVSYDGILPCAPSLLKISKTSLRVDQLQVYCPRSLTSAPKHIVIPFNTEKNVLTFFKALLKKNPTKLTETEIINLYKETIGELLSDNAKMTQGVTSEMESLKAEEKNSDSESFEVVGVTPANEENVVISKQELKDLAGMIEAQAIKINEQYEIMKKTVERHEKLLEDQRVTADKLKSFMGEDRKKFKI